MRCYFPDFGVQGIQPNHKIPELFLCKVCGLFAGSRPGQGPCLQPCVELKKAVSHYLTHLQDVGILVTGADIRKTGLVPGPHYAAILRAVKRAVLNGEVRTREEQLGYARRMSKSLQGQDASPKGLS